MKETKLSKEEDLIYRIVEQWGNAACGIQVMTQWLKDYAADISAATKSEHISVSPNATEITNISELLSLIKGTCLGVGWEGADAESAIQRIEKYISQFSETPTTA